MVFCWRNKGNWYGNGSISFTEYPYEFCFKKQERKICNDTTFIDYCNVFLGNCIEYVID